MNRYPELSNECIEDLIIEKSSILGLLDSLYQELVNENPKLGEKVEKLVAYKDIYLLQELCEEIFETIPMKDEQGEVHPLISTKEQLERYIKGDRKDLGDCKLLTLFTAYICVIKAQIPTAISIRNYSGHPVLFAELNDKAYKVSYLHESLSIKLFEGVNNPFDLTQEQRINTGFLDTDFPNDQSILFWNVTEAIFILDCMNILRRCVVNYVLDPKKYEEIFNHTEEILKNSGIYHNSILLYWEGEFGRIKHMYTDPRNKDPIKLREMIIKGLRF